MESKLTQILRESFGANARTFIITHVSPALEDYPQTLHAMNYAIAARGIRHSSDSDRPAEHAPAVHRSADLSGDRRLCFVIVVSNLLKSIDWFLSSDQLERQGDPDLDAALS